MPFVHCPWKPPWPPWCLAATGQPAHGGIGRDDQDDRGTRGDLIKMTGGQVHSLTNGMCTKVSRGICRQVNIGQVEKFASGHIDKWDQKTS